VLPGGGIVFTNEEDPQSADFGSASLLVPGYEPLAKGMWFRGRWIDGLSALWREISTGTFQANDGSNPGGRKGRNGGSLLLKGRLAPGESITYPVVIAWHFPNITSRIKGKAGAPSSCACSSCSPEPVARPYYASHWADAGQVAGYVAENYAALRRRTQAFHDALFATTMPSYILDAVSANLAIIKSPTVLLFDDGQLWGWEGCFSSRGCCAGTCTHVWNYAQSIPHLFPALERTLREQELKRSMDDRGHINFRAALPRDTADHAFHAAADGQLGGILKFYREWQISGDRLWLQDLYPLARRSLEFCIEAWDPKRQGVLVEPHHNTYDIEFWGPDGMCSSVYIGALAAMARLAVDSGHPEEAPAYLELAERGFRYLDEHLFNGEYYQQTVAYRGLRDTSFQDYVDSIGDSAQPEDLLLKNEGPKYQYGSGCISDGVIGAWLAAMCGIDHPLPPGKIRQNLKSIFQNNFQASLWDHANPQRPGYAIGDEPGLLLCTWPHGGKPTLPFVYSDEVWTGIEYQVASHLILAGWVDEGLTMVQALRSRYDGRVRNPWNEYECGSYYARAMASYALLLVLSGFFYSAVTRTLSLSPRRALSSFTTFFSTASGWGSLSIRDEILTVEVVEGHLHIDHLKLTTAERTLELHPGLAARPGAPAVIRLA
jgi:hypothetical protein